MLKRYSLGFRSLQRSCCNPKPVTRNPQPQTASSTLTTRSSYPQDFMQHALMSSLATHRSQCGVSIGLCALACVFVFVFACASQQASKQASQPKSKKARRQASKQACKQAKKQEGTQKKARKHKAISKMSKTAFFPQNYETQLKQNTCMKHTVSVLTGT